MSCTSDMRGETWHAEVRTPRTRPWRRKPCWWSSAPPDLQACGRCQDADRLTAPKRAGGGTRHRQTLRGFGIASSPPRTRNDARERGLSGPRAATMPRPFPFRAPLGACAPLFVSSSVHARLAIQRVHLPSRVVPCASWATPRPNGFDAALRGLALRCASAHTASERRSSGVRAVPRRRRGPSKATSASSETEMAAFVIEAPTAWSSEQSQQRLQGIQSVSNTRNLFSPESGSRLTAGGAGLPN